MMFRIAKILVAAAMLSPPVYGDHCRVQKQAVVVNQVAVPFVVPVGVVLPGSPMYSYRGSAQSYSNDVRTQDAKLFEEFLAWRSKREAEASSNQVRTQEIPQTLVQQNCVACHTPGNANSKPLAIEAIDMSKELTAQQKLDGVKALLLGTMPPGKTIDAQLRSDLAAELSGVEKAK